MNNEININEIFASINGEVNRWGQGSPAVFVRFQGCNLKCNDCDTEHSQSQSPKNMMTIHEIKTKIKSYGIKRVTITGGEPLLQLSVFDLIYELIGHRYQISVETNGSFIIPKESLNWKNTCWIVDYKLHDPDKMIWENYLRIQEGDWIKFVIDSKRSLLKAVQIKNELQLSGCVANFAFSPINANPKLANKIIGLLIQNKIDDVILNIQIHKIISAR